VAPTHLWAGAFPAVDGGCDTVRFFLPRQETVEVHEGSHLPPQMPSCSMHRHWLAAGRTEARRRDLQQEDGFNQFKRTALLNRASCKPSLNVRRRRASIARASHSVRAFGGHDVNVPPHFPSLPEAPALRAARPLPLMPVLMTFQCSPQGSPQRRRRTTPRPVLSGNRLTTPF